jgi:hypothetical protein
MSTNAYDILINQIDSFIRKYYKNQMVKGAIWFSIIFLLTFLLITTLEYFGRFNTPTRAVLFFGFILINLVVFVHYFFIPLLKLFSFSSRINHYQAAEIIGQFFPNISDRLLNTLQLNDNLNAQIGNIELIRASVHQRSLNLSVIPFGDAIDLTKNKRYLKWFFPLFLIALLIGIFFPNYFTESTKRVVNYSTTYVPEAPFKFQLKNYTKELVEGADLPLELKLVGEEIPQKVYLVSPYGKQLMEIKGRNTFVATIPKVMSAGSFYFIANDFSSNSYDFSVQGRPMVGLFTANLTYPKYLGKSNESISNVGDLIVPEGTHIEWNLATKNTLKSIFSINDVTQTFTNQGFKLAKVFKSSSAISVLLKGVNYTDTISFNVNIIKDAHPFIQVQEVNDSVSKGLKFFTGLVKDDYGLTNLKFIYTITSKNGSKRTQTLTVKPVSGIESSFDFAVDFMRESLQLEDKIEYYFIVSDNDGVNGFKSTKSATYTYSLPNLADLNKEHTENQENNKQNLNELLNQSQELKKNIEQLQKDLLNSKSTNWNHKNQLQSLKNQYNDLLKSIEQTQQSLNNSSEELQKLSPQDDEFLQKQDQINELLNQLMDKELLDLLNKLEQLVEQNNKDAQQQLLEDLKLSNEEMNKRLDRSLEMLKKMQVEDKINAIENELKQLAEEQLDLKKQTDAQSLSKDELLKKQEDINDKFNQLKDDLKQLEELNKDLNRPMDLPSTEELQNAIQEDINQSKDALSNDKNSKSSKKQQSAAEKMQQLSDQLNAAQQASNQQQSEEDMEALRSILESLVSLSLDQESTMINFTKVINNDPIYRKYAKQQRQIIDNTKIVSDSLYALAKRQPMLSKFVDEELKQINLNQSKALNAIGERETRRIVSHQQFAMTSYNNLALMLNESLQQMQQQMQQQMSSSGSCSNPGGKGKPKPGEGEGLGNIKEKLKKQLESLQKGQNPNGEKPGDSPGSKPGQGGSFGFGSKEAAKMAAEQQAIRQRLEQLRNELNKKGKGEGNQLNPLINEIEKQENDLINKRFSNDLIKRQQDILTRLLESEKALRERDFDDKRESKEGKNINNSNLIRFDEYNKEKLKQIELLRTVDPVYNKYYKDKAHQYFNLLKD